MREVVLECADESPLADGPWIVLPMPTTSHVLPEAELCQHELDRGCWCGPEVELRDPVTELEHVRPLVIHQKGSSMRLYRG